MIISSALFVAAPAVDVLNLSSLTPFIVDRVLSSQPIASLSHSHLPTLASSIPTRRPAAFSASTASNAADEEYINRSLLDSLNAEADAEPMSSSDSEALATSGNTLGASATTSAASGPSVPYHVSVQQQQPQQPSRPDSPGTNNVLPNYLGSPPMSADPYAQSHASSQQLYNSMNNIQHLPPDFVPSSEHDALNSQTSLNGFSSGPFRTGLQFNPFNSRTRQNTAPLRDTSSSFAVTSYPSQDIFVPSAVTQTQNATSPTSFEPIHHPGRYEYGLSASQSVPSLLQNGQTKQTGFSAMDAYRLGLEPSSAQPFKAAPPGIMRDTQSALQQPGAQQAFPSSHLNGISHPISHQGGLQPQGPFGSHPSASSGGPVGAQGSSILGVTNAMQGSQQQPQEEISTIFVVGFPDDMTV